MKKLLTSLLLMGLFSLIFGCGKKTAYYKESGKWFFDGVRINRQSEPAHFKPLNDTFAKDDQHGYYRGIPIDDSDSASFEPLSEHDAKDKSAVYYCDTYRDSKEYWSIKRSGVRRVAEADPASYRLLGDSYYARDNQHLFFSGELVAVKDVETFAVLEYGFNRDKVRGYRGTEEIAGSDGASFSVLDSHYAKDRSKIYFERTSRVWGPLEGANVETFKALDDGYATDGKHAYYNGVVITGDDAGTLQFLSMGYAKTLHQVFHHGKLMRDADAASFETAKQFNDKFDATDKYGSFSGGERVK